MLKSNEVTSPSNIPLRLLRPLKLRKTSNVSGVFWSFRTTMPPMLLLNWDGAQYAAYLGGDRTMSYFPINPDVSLGGVVAQGGEFLVDVSSRYDAVQRIDPLGALILRGGKASLIGAPLGQAFADTVPIPLWGEFDSAGEDEAVGFTRWSLIIRDGSDVLNRPGFAGGSNF